MNPFVNMQRVGIGEVRNGGDVKSHAEYERQYQVMDLKYLTKIE